MSFIYTYTYIHTHNVNTQIHKHLPAGIVKKDTIHPSCRLCFRQGHEAVSMHSWTQLAHAQNIWMFKLISLQPLEVIAIPTGAKIIHKQSALVSVVVQCDPLEDISPSCHHVCLFSGAWVRMQTLEDWGREDRMSGCDRAFAALISFFLPCLYWHRQRPHLRRSITFVYASHWSNTSFRKITSISLPLFQMWSLGHSHQQSVQNISR